MTPAARVAAAIEVLDEALASARSGGPAADVLLARYFRARRYAGSKDRAAVRELVYAVLRTAGYDAASGRSAFISYATSCSPDLLGLFGSGGHAPAALTADENDVGLALAWLPQWLEQGFEERFGSAWPAHREGLTNRAPLDLRVNSLKCLRQKAARLLEEEGILTEPLALSPWGLRAAAGSPVEKSHAFAEGLVEVQDLASQLMLRVAAARPGEVVVDLCAGAGGKTLGLAATMANRGRIIACDIDAIRLERMQPRASRAGVGIVEARGLAQSSLDDLVSAVDCVVVDAPCSGTGTWRRNPEARFRITPGRVRQLTDVQEQVLAQGAKLTKVGGRLIYGVCSLLPIEAEDRIRAFLDHNANFRLADYRDRLDGPEAPDSLSAMPECLCVAPATHGCDGFFVAVLERVC